MKTSKKQAALLMIVMFAFTAAFAQTANESKTKKETTMKNKMNTYLIERQIPNAGTLTAEQLQGISQKSCGVLKELGTGIEWIQSYVVADKIFCVYRAENEEILKIHAEKGGFPINSVSKLSTIISPATATAPLAEVIRQ